jgi:hypothetical protein
MNMIKCIDMPNMNSMAIAFVALFVTFACGCSDKDYVTAPVSGTVTFEGEPVGKLRVSFNPAPVGENYAVGPYSRGTTDADGKFTLTTRYDDDGAVVGKHTLALQYSDISETAMADLRDGMLDAQEAGDKAGFDDIKKKIVELKAKLKGRPVLKQRYTKVLDVPSAGHADLQIELSEM